MYTGCCVEAQPGGFRLWETPSAQSTEFPSLLQANWDPAGSSSFAFVNFSHELIDSS